MLLTSRNRKNNVAELNTKVSQKDKIKETSTFISPSSSSSSSIKLIPKLQELKSIHILNNINENQNQNDNNDNINNNNNDEIEDLMEDFKDQTIEYDRSIEGGDDDEEGIDPHIVSTDSENESESDQESKNSQINSSDDSCSSENESNKIIMSSNISSSFSSSSSSSSSEKNKSSINSRSKGTTVITKPVRNAFQALQSYSTAPNLAKAKRDIRTKKRLQRKKQHWEEKVSALEKKTKACRSAYKNKSIKDIRKLIERPNSFKPGNAWLPPTWTPKNPEIDDLLLNIKDIDDIESVAESWSERWRPNDVEYNNLNNNEINGNNKNNNFNDNDNYYGYQKKSFTKREDKILHSVPILRIHCADKLGSPVLLRVHGYRPYFYAKVPESFQIYSEDYLCEQLKLYLEDSLSSTYTKGPKIIRITCDEGQTIMGFHVKKDETGKIVPRLDRFFKITVSMPSLISNCKNILNPWDKYDSEAGAVIPDPNGETFIRERLDLFNCEMTLPFQFISEKKAAGQIWFTVPSKTYEQNLHANGKNRTDYQVEIDVHHNALKFHDFNEPEYSSIAPARILSIDIECAGEKGRFPKPETAPVISIAAVLQSTDFSQKPEKAIFSWKIGIDQFDSSWIRKKRTQIERLVELVQEKGSTCLNETNNNNNNNKKRIKHMNVEIENAQEYVKMELENLNQDFIKEISNNNNFQNNKDEKEEEEEEEEGIDEQRCEEDPVYANYIANRTEAYHESQEFLIQAEEKNKEKQQDKEEEEECMSDDENETLYQSRCKTSKLDDAELWEFNDEKDFLLAFAEFLRAVKPDIFTGFNILNFDIPYSLDRARVLGLEAFPFWGPTLEPVIPEYSMFNSAAWGEQERVNIKIPGMVLYDFLRWIKPEIKLKSYTLNSVANALLKEMKDDLHHSLISRMFYGPDHARRRLFRYNLKDAILPLLCIKKRLSWVRDSEMARVCKVMLPWLTNRGQGIKTMSQLQPQMSDEKLLRPYTPKPPRKTNQEQAPRRKFEGAHVLKPIIGLHKKPVATLDYNSLYPSIMITHNLSYETMIDEKDLHFFSTDDYHTVIIDTAKNEKRYFVKKHIKEGLLPKILRGLLSTRKVAKNEMAAAEEALNFILRDVLDSRQNALKVSANSVYGFPAAQMMECQAISAAVTYYGRGLIDLAKEKTETRFCRKNGYAHDCRVLYGDTDSIMIEFGNQDLAEVSKLGYEAQNLLNDIFKKDNDSVLKIEFEKMYVNFLLLAPKNYAAYKYPPKATKLAPPELLGTKEYPLDMKGIETVRRDKIGLTQRICEQLLILCLRDLNPDAAIEYCKKEITALLQGKIDLSELILSKGLKLYYDEDSVLPAHAQLAEILRQRDPGSAPIVGDRVPYVLIIKGKKSSKSEQAEDPWYAMVNRLPIDYVGYFENHIKKALLRLLGPVIPERLDELWSLTKSVKLDTHLTKQGGLICNYTQKGGKCMKCNNPISNSPGAIICENCKKTHGNEIKQKYIVEQEELNKESTKIWTNCKTCVGKYSDENDCNNRDCRFLYRRWIKRDELQTCRGIIAKMSDW